MYYQIFIDEEWHKDFQEYEDALDYAEKYPLGSKVEIKKFKI